MPFGDSLGDIVFFSSMRGYLLLALAVLLAATALAAGSGTDDKELVQKLDGQIRRAIATEFSGSVLVARSRRVLLERGYGWADANHTRRTTPGTRYWVASISKQFTAAAILKLEEQEKLSTADPISRFLSGVPPDKRAITIHQLLTHTSGIRQNYAADGIPSVEEAVRAICTQPVLSPPGDQFHYANDNYNLLAIIVQLASGEHFEDYLRKQLFVPAGMEHSGFWAMLSKTETEETAPVLKQVSEASARPNWGFRGATGVLSTTGDLFRWQQALFAGRILGAAARDKLLRGYVKLSDTEVAYGWFRSLTARGRLVLWTRGSEEFGHNAVIKVYPDQDLVLVVASNAGERGDKTKAASRILSDELEEIIDSR
jgi:CubicO group peptidase (beta-lactamase class C family)